MPLFGGGSGGDEGWKEIGVVNASDSQINLNLSGFTAYDEYRFSIFLKMNTSSNRDVTMTFNSDTGSNYDYKAIDWDAGIEYQTAQSGIKIGRVNNSNPEHITGTISNFEAGSKKIVHARSYSFNEFQTAKAGGIWNNTASRITEVNIQVAYGVLSGSEFVLMGRNYSS